MSDTPRDCEHGQLARACRVCELERELAAVTAERDATCRMLKALQDEMADYDRNLLKRFDATAAESTDLFTWIACMLEERKRAVAKLERAMQVVHAAKTYRYVEAGESDVHEMELLFDAVEAWEAGR